MDILSIDWDQVWKEQREKHHRFNRGAEHWNKRASSFANHAGKTGYAGAFLKIMKPVRSWTVLDMASGAGTLAIPLASKVKEITAVDFSDNMLDILRGEARRLGIRNISTIKASWEEDWDKAGIGLYDVAIASRSLSMDEIRDAILKLNRAARKRVYISTAVGDGPFDRNIIMAAGRDFIPQVDYIYVYNLLYQMGICANVAFIVDKNSKTFDDHEAALNSFRWMVEAMSAQEEDLLREYLHKHLVTKAGKWVIDYEKTTRWAVIWWDKDYNMRESIK